MFQVARFLQRFPQTRGAHQSLVQDLTEHPELLPLRTDFEGNIHLQTYEELVSFSYYYSFIFSCFFFYIFYMSRVKEKCIFFRQKKKKFSSDYDNISSHVTLPHMIYHVILIGTFAMPAIKCW